MAEKNSRKVCNWSEVVELTASESGLPKKQIEETAEAVNVAIQHAITNYQPKKAGDSSEIRTKYGAYISTRQPATVITDASGKKVPISECCVMNVCIPNSYINAANIGLIDNVGVEKESKKKGA